MDSRLTFSSSTKHFWSLNPQNSVAAFECMKPKLREDIIYTLDGWSNCAATSNRVCAGVFSLAAATVTISTFKSLTFQISLGFPGFLRLELHWTRCKEPFYVFPVFFILQVAICFGRLGEGCNAVLLQSSRNVPWTTWLDQALNWHVD